MVGFADLLFTCPHIALIASRTLAKVKSSAISPRQPEVPNLIGEVVITAHSSVLWAFAKYESNCSAGRTRAVGFSAPFSKTTFGRAMMKIAKTAKMTSTARGAGADGRIVLVTVPSLLEGRRMAKSVVKKRLAACVNMLLSPVN